MVAPRAYKIQMALLLPNVPMSSESELKRKLESVGFKDPILHSATLQGPVFYPNNIIDSLHITLTMNRLDLQSQQQFGYQDCKSIFA